MLHRRLTCLDDHDDAVAHLAALDFLGRMPVPLRHGFTAGLDQAAAAAGGRRVYFVKGNEWYAPFHALARAQPMAAFPRMVLTPFTRDVLSVSFQQRLRAAGHAAATPRPIHPAAAGLIDPAGLFSVFGVIPW